MSESQSEFVRTPPHDDTAEQSVLGGMMLSKDAIADVVEVIGGGADFYKPAHEMIYEAIINLYGHGEPADAITVADELTKRGELNRVGGAAYLHSLIASVPTAANAGFYAEIVAERAMLRRLVEAGTKIVQLGYSGDGEAEDLVNAAQAEIYGVSANNTREDYVPLSEAMNSTVEEIEANGSRAGGIHGVPTGFIEFDELTAGLQPGQMVVVAARPAMGKALALDTPIPTPEGWTTMGDIRVGDLVLGADGRPTKVINATEVMTGRPCYTVTFDDGTRIIADAEHQWLTHTRASRRARIKVGAGGPAVDEPQLAGAKVRTTAEIHETVRCATADNRANHCISNASALQLPDADLPIAPYTLGVWLGDGAAASARITTADDEVLQGIEADGYDIGQVQGLTYSVHLPQENREFTKHCQICGKEFTHTDRNVTTCSRTCGGKRKNLIATPQSCATCIDCGRPCTAGLRCLSCHRSRASVQGRLRTLGVLNNKHIPMSYLRASELQRRALLAGLLDSYGTVTNAGCVQFVVTNRQLALDVQELVHSLGYRTGLRTKKVAARTPESSTAYKLTFSTSDTVFGLSRKNQMHRERDARPTAKRTWRYIVSVEPVESVPVRCIEVDNSDHLFLASSAFVPTHNSTFALDIARSAAIKHKMTTVFFSLEMGRNEIAMKILSAEAGINLSDLRKGRLDDDQWAKIATAMGKMDSAPLFIDDSPNMTLMEIRAKARRLKQKNDLKLIVLDYLQLMSSGKKVESRQQEVSEFSRALKLMAKELEVPLIALSQLNRGSEQRPDKKPQVSDLRESGCLTADTRILRSDIGAEVTIAELFAQGARDIPVWSLGDDMRFVERHLTHVFSTGVKPVYRLTLASGKTLRATANHPFFTYTGWKGLGELSVGDRLGVPRHVNGPSVRTRWTDEQVILLAHMIGDGSALAHQPIRYASIDPENLDAVAESARKQFGITGVRDTHPAARCTSLRLPSPEKLTHGKGNPLAAWLDELGLFDKRSWEKFIPEQVFALPKRQIALFIKHLWATDGSVTLNKNGRAGRIYYGSTSRALVDQLSLLLLRFGINSRVRASTIKGEYRQGYSLDISGRDEQLRFLREISSYGERAKNCALLLAALTDGGSSSNTNGDTAPVQVWDDVRKILSEEGMSHREFQAAMGSQYCGSSYDKSAPSGSRLEKVATVLDAADLEMLAVNDLFWDTVTGIEYDGEEEVFDATVLGNHNFVANGITVHNSIEQDADMVILLHREDYYDKESTRAGEADVIVAKHRNGPTKTIAVAFQGHYSRFANMVHDSYTGTETF
ncbi:replicative DNA helicase [Rothia sp. P4278]|uniref:replicative DNA helicase n=1 Tax=Rothia sp. P4278 TaxID=3402658 RepID=UPI003ADD78C4